MEIKVTCDGTDYIDYRELKPFQGNLKTLSDENLEKLKKSIIKYGFTVPAFIWDNGEKYILDAHQRMKALDSLFHDGYKIPPIPVVYIEAKDGKEAKEKLLHITSQYGEFSEQGLTDFLLDANIDIDSLDIRLTDSEFSININQIDETIGDDELTEDVAPITKLGDLWELGNHRLLCGDSTDKETVNVLMNGQKADMVFTDPPYGVKYQSNMRVVSDKFDIIKNDDTELDFIPIIEMYSDGWVFIWTTWKVVDKWIKKTESIGFPSNMIIWFKGGGGIGDLKRTFSTDYEIALVFNRGTELKGKRIGSVWSIGKDGASQYLHPTQKPVELAVEAIDKTTTKGYKVLDLFLGSGSTLIACEKTNRICYGMELDPHYCDVIVKRYIDWCDKNERESIIRLNGEIFDKQRIEQ